MAEAPPTQPRSIRRDSVLLPLFRRLLLNDKLRVGSGAAIGLVVYYLAVERQRIPARSEDNAS
jgi:hypothetical protein